MDEDQDSVDDSLESLNLISSHSSDQAKQPICTNLAIPSESDSDTISKEIQKAIAEYNDNLFWNIRS